MNPARPHPPEHPVNLAPMEGRRGKGKGGKRGGGDGPAAAFEKREEAAAGCRSGA